RALRPGRSIRRPPFAPSLFPFRRTRPPIAPLSSRPIAGRPVAALGTFAGFLTRKIGVTVLVRRLLYPGGQKFQIEKIRRGFLLGHESLYALGGGCKIGDAIWQRLLMGEKSKIN